MEVDNYVFCSQAFCEKLECKKHPIRIPRSCPVNVTNLRNTEYCQESKD